MFPSKLTTICFNEEIGLGFLNLKQQKQETENQQVGEEPWTHFPLTYYMQINVVTYDIF